MKSFEEFWTSLTEEDFANFADIANERADSIETENMIPNTILGTKISIQNTMMTMQILKRYHEWISEQLDKQLSHQFQNPASNYLR